MWHVDAIPMADVCMEWTCQQPLWLRAPGSIEPECARWDGHCSTLQRLWCQFGIRAWIRRRSKRVWSSCWMARLQRLCWPLQRLMFWHISGQPVTGPGGGLRWILVVCCCMQCSHVVAQLCQQAARWCPSLVPWSLWHHQELHMVLPSFQVIARVILPWRHADQWPPLPVLLLLLS